MEFNIFTALILSLYSFRSIEATTASRSFRARAGNGEEGPALVAKALIFSELSCLINLLCLVVSGEIQLRDQTVRYLG